MPLMFMFMVEKPSAKLSATKLCAADQDDSHTVIITDSNVDGLYTERIAEPLADLGCEVDILVVEPGEQSKAAEVASELWEKMLDEGADRTSVVLALGGGVVGDLVQRRGRGGARFSTIAARKSLSQ